MSNRKISDAEVEMEIAALVNYPMVKLAKRDMYIKNRRRQYLYALRSLRKKGEELAKAGVTMEVLTNLDKMCDILEGEE